MEAEFGRPQWGFVSPAYAFESGERIICTYVRQGTSYLASLDTHSLELQPIDTPYTYLGALLAAPGRAVFHAGSAVEPLSIVQLDLATGEIDVLRRAHDLEIDRGYLSEPRAIEFPTENGLAAHAFYYPPKNKDFAAPDGEKPPLLVMSHGGPTGAATTTLDLEIQYWTSRGVGVLDVNYGGSTGYGREYRERLNGQWGVVDVDDCTNGARYLVEQGKVDPDRLAITGGSAGGYTTLCALTFRDLFKAGASHFGISDLEAFTKDTHKFESRYLDRLVGPMPEKRELYRERSAIHYTDRLSCPLILFQGLEDKVVPPNQAELMLEALRAKGLPVAYLPFEGEQHGFRQAKNIKRTLDAELYFYSRIFGFELAEPVEPVEIENL
jgi:dipeptidyl aminopeptidase/acylaminoacyl peptidase